MDANWKTAPALTVKEVQRIHGAPPLHFEGQLQQEGTLNFIDLSLSGWVMHNSTNMKVAVNESSLHKRFAPIRDASGDSIDNGTLGFMCRCDGALGGDKPDQIGLALVKRFALNFCQQNASLGFLLGLLCPERLHWLGRTHRSASDNEKQNEDNKRGTSS